MIVGDDDLDTRDIVHEPGGRYWTDGANSAGATRPERLRALERSFLDAGISVRFDLLPGVGHEADPVFSAAMPFLAEHLRIDRRGSADVIPSSIG